MLKIYLNLLKIKMVKLNISEDVIPTFVMFIIAILGLSLSFLLVLTDVECPKCHNKLHRHKRVDYILNNSVHMKKMTYRCSNPDCRHVVTPTWSKYIELGCNYSNAVKEYALIFRLNR